MAETLITDGQSFSEEYKTRCLLLGIAAHRLPAVTIQEANDQSVFLETSLAVVQAAGTEISPNEQRFAVLAFTRTVVHQSEVHPDRVSYARTIDDGMAIKARISATGASMVGEVTHSVNLDSSYQTAA